MVMETIFGLSLLVQAGVKGYQKVAEVSQGLALDRQFPGMVLVTRRGQVQGLAQDFDHAVGFFSQLQLGLTEADLIGYLLPLPPGVEARYVLPYYRSKGRTVGD